MEGGDGGASYVVNCQRQITQSGSLVSGLLGASHDSSVSMVPPHHAPPAISLCCLLTFFHLASFIDPEKS